MGRVNSEIFLQEEDQSKSVMILKGKNTLPETKSDCSRLASHWLKPFAIGQFKKGIFGNTNRSFAHHDMLLASYMSLKNFMIPIEIDPWNEGQINTLTALEEQLRFERHIWMTCNWSLTWLYESLQ